MKKAILLLIAIVLTLSIFIAASASLPVGTEICAEDNESSLQTATMPAQGGVGNYSKGDTSNITPVAVSADTGDNLGNAAKKMLNDAPSNESNLTKRYVDDKGRVLDEVIVPGVPPEERISEPPVLTKRYVDDKGRVLDEVIVPGVPPGERISEAPVSSFEIKQADAVLSNVPAFDWCYGCSATSAAMMFGYYDRTGYSNMYAGPTNGGVCPLDNSDWGSNECSLSATHQGYDGLAVKGHVDDYWSTFGSTVDPYDDNWAEHGYADCTADFMGTNQYVNWQNKDGSTRFYYNPSGDPLYDYTDCEPGGKRDGCHGIKLFVESRGYNVIQNYNQRIDKNVTTGGFTYADFKAEIDAGRPVIIHVTRHSMLGYGYDDPDTIYIHDTWSHTGHSMTWGGTYSGLEHYAVTVIEMPYTCGNMGVNPTSWSPTLNCGESDNEIVTVSATGGTVEGVTVSKVSGPTWLSVSPTNLGDIASGSSKTFTMTAAPPSETSGDFTYTVRVSNTCGTPSTRDVSGAINVDCIEPNQPPSYSNPSVSPSSGTPSTQFDYSVDVSDPDGDTVTVTLKTYDPSDGSWEDQGYRNVVGSGTASWNDLTPFEVDDKGKTAKYTFEFDDGYNSGEWGPFNGPAIETDACFSNWDYPSTSMATEKIPVEVDIFNPHGVKSAWLHYDYGDDGSEDGVTQMSLITVRSAKPEIQGGSSSGLGVKAQKIAVSESAPLSGGGGSGVAEREGIQKSIYLYDAKTCKDVEDSDPYDPIGVTTVFSPTDSASYTWLQFNDIWSSHTVKWDWYDPNGNFYTDCTYMIPDPSDSGQDHWDWYNCWCGIYIDGYAAAEEEGIWTVIVYLDGGHIETLYFNIEYIISDYTMCKNVQASSPYDPIERTSTFLADDEKAVSWLRLDDVTNSLNVRWDWYDPSGTLYSTWDTDTSNPADEGYDYWDWTKAWCYIYIKDYAAAGKPGEWVVKVYIDDEYEFEEEFTIYPDDARYKCEIPAPGMGYEGDEVSFYVRAYSAYDSPTDSAKHLVDIYVPDDPTLSFSPSLHDFGDKCEGETDSTTFEVWNSGTGTLTYSLSETCSWVEVNPTSGSSTGEHATITVDIDTTGLSEGLHTCDITISSNDGTGTFTVMVNIVPKPDLIITEKWLCWPDNCTSCYNVTNIGDGTAPACHNTTLYVDGVAVAHDHVPVDIAPGESYTGCFNGYEWGYTPPSDEIKVCADNSETLDELDEDNNCLTNIWMCGDVNGDRAVNVIDVVLIYKRALDPGYPLDLPWAGDVNCDCNINVIDVVMVYKRALDPGYDLDCCCEVV